MMHRSVQSILNTSVVFSGLFLEWHKLSRADVTSRLTPASVEWQVTGFTLPFVYGRGLFALPVGPLPHQVPLTAVVGAPIAVPKFTGKRLVPCRDRLLN